MRGMIFDFVCEHPGSTIMEVASSLRNHVPSSSTDVTGVIRSQISHMIRDRSLKKEKGLLYTPSDSKVGRIARFPDPNPPPVGDSAPDERFSYPLVLNAEGDKIATFLRIAGPSRLAVIVDSTLLPQSTVVDILEKHPRIFKQMRDGLWFLFSAKD